ncbi:acyltransferase family protein [Schlesneria sp. DSM 10557]|uniref:acyltransferase family protein n=1 Tax=Schlesneria sp. DSM 10557 TaxID=3044399 RepID=UPI0035A1412C
MSSQNDSAPKTLAGWQSDSFGKNNLDFCRFWLAVLVIFSHSYALAEGHEENEPLGLFTHGQLNSGPFAVCGFFIISGFLITHSWLRSKSAVDYLKKRAFRIYPGFIVVVLLGVFVIAPFVSENLHFGVKRLLTIPISLLALRNVDLREAFVNNPYPGTMNGSLWSIPYEFKCYLAVMAIGAAGMLTRRRGLVPWLFLVTLIAGALYPFFPVPALDKGPFAAIVGSAEAWSRVFPYFIAGLAFYVYRKSIPFSTPLFVASVIAFVAASFAPPAGRFVFPFAITYALFWFSFHPAIHFENWSRYGDFSYGIYLYAFPIQQLIALSMPGVSAITMFFIATPLSILAGAISWHLVEKHFLKMKHRPAKPVEVKQPAVIDNAATLKSEATNLGSGVVAK